MKYFQPKQLLEVEFFNYQLYFFLTPTWEINPDVFPQLTACDFALGCLDYLRGLPPQYFLLKEYLNGYQAIKQFIDLTTASNYCYN